MTSFALTDEHEQLRATVAEFARDVVAPAIGGFYERGEFPYDIVTRMGKLGLFGLPFPEQYGGMGGDLVALCLALHELARVDSSVAITLEAGVALGAMPVYRFGSAEQQARWLPELCLGERLAAASRPARRKISGRDVLRVGSRIAVIDHSRSGSETESLGSRGRLRRITTTGWLR